MRFTSLPLLALGFTAAAAQVGTLDPTFDVDGMLTTDFREYDIAFDVAVRPDGTILAFGTTEDVGVPGQREGHVAHYDPDGTLAQSWRYEHYCFGPRAPLGFRAGLIEPDGRLLAAGVIQDGCSGNGERNFLISRLPPGGGLTSPFEKPPFHGYDEEVWGIARRADGKVVAAGFASSALDVTTYDLAFARYNDDGTLDDTFGTDGAVLIDVAGDYDFTYAVALQPDGKVVAAGFASEGGQRDFLLVRLDEAGALDASFDGDGILAVDFHGFNDIAYDVVVQPDGRIVAAGARTAADGVTTEFLVARFEPDGTPDASFGTGGVVAVDFTGRSAIATELLLQPSGELLVSGFTETGAGGVETRDFAVVRLLPDGALDPSFDADGKNTADVSGGGYDYAYAMALQPDGHLVLAGFTERDVDGETHRDFALARFLGDTPPVANEPGVAPGTSGLDAAPNPFAGQTTIRYDLPAAGRVWLAIYDLLGREVAVLVDGAQAAGTHEAVLDGAGLPSGVYVVRMTAGDFVPTRRLTLLR